MTYREEKILIYLFIWIIIFILTIFEILNFKINKNILKILILVLILITGFRYNNGTDYNTYSQIFNYIRDMNDGAYIESGFRGIVVLNNKILNYNYNFLIFSFFNFIFLYFALKKIKYSILGLFIYINLFWIGYSFNAMRQGIAMNCFLMALLSSNFSRYFLFIFSVLIHKISFPIFLISKCISLIRRKIKYRNLIIFVFSISFIILSNIIVGKLREIIPKLDLHATIFKNYTSISGLIFRILTLVIFICFEKKIRKKDREDVLYRKILNIYIFGFLEYLAFYKAYTFGTRINMFFRIIEIILYSKIFSNLKKTNKRLFLFLILSIIWGLVYYTTVIFPDNSPYQLNPYFFSRN